MKKLITVMLLVLIFALSSCVFSLPGNHPLETPLPTSTPIVSEESSPAPEPASAEPTEAMETAAPISADDTSGMIDAATEKYAAIIGFYRDFMQSDLEDEDIDTLCVNISNELAIDSERELYELSCSCFELRYVTEVRLSYAIHDINRDGIYELIILSEDYFIHSVYTLNNETPVLLGAFWSRSRCVIDSDGVLYTHGSSGAADSISASHIIMPKAASLSLIEKVGTESFDEETLESFDEARCYHIKDGKKTIISYEELQIEWERFPDTYPDNPTENLGLVLNYLSK